MRQFDVANKQVVVVGLGRSGVAVTQFLVRQGARVTVTDRAPADSLSAQVEALKGLDVRFKMGGHDEKDAVDADLIVLSPGVPHTLPMLERARQKGVSVVGEMALAAGRIQEPIVAVTGTNGKTTTTELVGEMLKRSGTRVFIGGNIGTPLISYVEGLYGQADVVVVEVSSFQLDSAIDFQPDTAVVLNLTDDHLDRYENFSAYARSKWRIFEHQSKAHKAVVNGKDAAIAEMMKTHPPRSACWFFSDKAVPDGARIYTDAIGVFEKGQQVATFSLDRAGITGPHNRENIAAACLAARTQGASDDGIQQAIDAYKGLSHRLERVGKINGVHFWNDSKATNVDAVRRALECFAKPVVLIMGGQNKKGDFTQLRTSVHHRVKKLVVVGEATEEICEALADEPKGGCVKADSLEDAVEKAIKGAEPGETVLFSPACASFDMFDNYVQRGNRFREIVKGLQCGQA